LVSGYELYKIASWIIFGMIAGYCVGREVKINDVVNVWLTCAGIIAIYGILQYFGIDFMQFRLQHHRIVANFGNPTLLAGFLAMTLPVAVARIYKPQTRIGVNLPQCGFGVCIVILLLTCLVLTRSRAGIAVALAGIFILFIGTGKIKFRSAMLIVAGILGVVFILTLLPLTKDVIFDTITRKTLRFDIWSNTFQLIRADPLMGTGIGTFSLYFPNFVTEDILKAHFVGVEFVNHAHSEYLEIFSEMGILGLAAFLVVIGTVIARRPVQPPRLPLWATSEVGQNMRAGLFAAFIVVLLNNIVGVDLRYTSTGMFFWMMTGMLTAGKSEAISYQPSAINRRRPVLNAAIMIAALIVIYFTVKPYMEIQKVRGQDFFSKDISRIDNKIENMESAGEEKDADYFFNLGVLYAKKEDFKKATECFFAAVEKNPLHAGAYNNLGNINVVMGNIESAEGFFQKAVEAEPASAEYLINLASARFKLNKMEQGMAALEKALVIDPDNSRALLLRRQMTQ
jgi:O-antigen ligase